MKTSPTKKAMLSLVSHPLFYIFLWLFYLIILVLHTSLTPVNLLFAFATLLLFSHVLYGGYYLFKNGKSLDTTTALSALGVLFLLFFFVQTSSYSKNWFLALAATFIIAIVYHQRTRMLVKKEYLKEFCNYKTYIEIQGSISSVIGYLLAISLPHYIVWIGILNICVIIKINYNIMFKKNLYSIKYVNARPLKNPLVSVIIITYNEEKNIGKLFTSIKDQTYKKFEVILVDDHSTDKTQEIAKRYAKIFPLKIVQKEIRGQSRSRNYGAAFAKGKLLLFLDADGTLPEEFMKKSIEEFNKKKLASAFSDFSVSTKNFLDSVIVKFYRAWLKTVQYYHPRAIGFCIWARKEIHDKTLFDPTIIMSEDFEYIQRASRLGKFRIITSAPIKGSWRRFERENRIWLLIKYLYFETYRNLFGEIRKPLAKYSYGEGKHTLNIQNEKI